MFCGLGEEERTKFRKKKKGKKGKKRKKPHRGQKWVGWMKGYLETYNHMKYFLPYLSRFWLRLLFTPNLRGCFRVLQSKSRDLLPRNLVQTCNSLKLLSKFHVARPNRSRVISKSLKFCTR